MQKRTCAWLDAERVQDGCSGPRHALLLLRCLEPRRHEPLHCRGTLTVQRKPCQDTPTVVRTRLQQLPPRHVCNGKVPFCLPPFAFQSIRSVCAGRRRRCLWLLRVGMLQVWLEMRLHGVLLRKKLRRHLLYVVRHRHAGRRRRICDDFTQAASTIHQTNTCTAASSFALVASLGILQKRSGHLDRKWV